VHLSPANPLVSPSLVTKGILDATLITNSAQPWSGASC